MLFLMMLPSFWSWGQGCPTLNFDVGEPVQEDCYTVKVPVTYILLPVINVCNLSIAGSIAGNNVTIADVVVASGYEDVLGTLYYEGSEFSFTSPNFEEQLVTSASGGTVLFEVYVEADPDEPFTFSLEDVTFNTGANCGTDCTKTPTIFNNGAMQGPSIDSCDDPLESYTDYRFVVDADDTGGDMVIIPLDHFEQRGQYASVPVKFIAPDRVAMDAVEVLDFEIEVDDVYGNLSITGVDLEYSSSVLNVQVVPYDPATGKLRGTVTFTDVYGTEAVVGAMDINDPQSITLFDLELEAPYDAPQGGSFTLTTEFVRVSYESGSSTACCLPAAEGGGSVDLDEFKYPCGSTPALTFVDVNCPIEKNGKLEIWVRAPSVPGASMDDFALAEAYIEVELFLEGGYTINVVDTEALMNSEVCPSACTTGCVTVSGNKVIYNPCAQGDTVQDDAILFKIIIDKGMGGGIAGLRFNRADWDSDNAGTDCAPTVVKPDFGSLAGEVEVSGEVNIYCGSTGPGLPNVNMAHCGPGSVSLEVMLTEGDGSFEYNDVYACLTEAEQEVGLGLAAEAFIYEPTCGISTLDLILISQHVLNVNTFAESWRYIAADVDYSDDVSDLDVRMLRSLILGQIASLPGGDWRFMPQGFDLVPNTSGEDPFVTANNWNEVKTVFGCGYYDLDQPSLVSAIKIGDVSGNACDDCSGSNASGGATVKVTNATTAQDLLNGKVAGALQVPAGASISELMGFQGALRYDTAKLAFDGIRAKDLPYVDTNIIAHSPGVLRLSWYDESVGGESLSAGDRLLELSFSLLSGSFSAGDIWLDTALMKAEAYLGSSSIVTRHLVLDASGSGLMQAPGTGGSAPAWQARVHPNPSSGTFELRVNTATAQSGRIVVVDGTGRALYEREAALPKGQSSFTIESAERWPKGLYFLQLYADGEPVYTEKLIKQ